MAKCLSWLSTELEALRVALVCDVITLMRSHYDGTFMTSNALDVALKEYYTLRRVSHRWSSNLLSCQSVGVT